MDLSALWLSKYFSKNAQSSAKKSCDFKNIVSTVEWVGSAVSEEPVVLQLKTI